MRITSFIGVLLALGCAIAIGLFVRHKKAQNSYQGTTIGVLQFASHPALDQVRDGFIQEIGRLFGSDARVVVQNAEGSMVVAQSIAQGFTSDNTVKAVLAIATPAAQVVHATMQNKPLLIAAVSDPQGAGLLSQGANVAGSSDKVDGAKLASLVLALVPRAMRVAILFNPAELNASRGASEIESALTAAGKQVLRVGLSEGADVATAVQVACGKVDAIVCPCDNTVASNIGVIASLTRRARKPCIVSDYLLVPHGVLAACGVDYVASGVYAAGCAHAILREGKTANQLQLGMPEDLKIVVHQQLAHELGLTPAPEIAARISWCTQELPHD